MPRLLQQLARQFTLMVSLPQNTPEMAEAAIQGGAHAIKVHLNCHHFASDTRFGPWKDERPALLEILQLAGRVPVGIVTGEEVQPGPEELGEIQEAGFDFWDLFARYTPPAYLRIPRLGRMVAIDSSWTPEQVVAMARLGVHVIESSIIPREHYRSPLNLADLAAYAHLAGVCPIPILVPTQKAIRPQEVDLLAQADANGVTIGAVVTGTRVEGVREATLRFREAVDKVVKPSPSGVKF
ncbi:MAG: hypothetical protein HY319_29495 [Armatimonadetes bacterium]|nr:hypothetical protein [Armatimonadota bacterium]